MNTQYNKRYFSERDRLDIHIAKSIAILMRDNALKRTLDVGCGTGKLVYFLNKNGLDAFGCDNADIAIERAKKINKKDVIVKASATKLPFRKESFDLITSISTIEHLTQKEVIHFLKEAHRILKPSGFLFLITPNYASPMRFILGKKWFAYSDPTHITFFTPLSLASLLKHYGFHKPKFWFKTNDSIFWKKFIYYLLFSTPFCFIRDSFWIAAQKNEQET